MVLKVIAEHGLRIRMPLARSLHPQTPLVTSMTALVTLLAVTESHTVLRCICCVNIMCAGQILVEWNLSYESSLHKSQSSV